MNGWRYVVTVAAAAVVLAGCGTASTAPIVTAPSMSGQLSTTAPTATTIAGPTASSMASPVALDAPLPVALAPRQTLDLANVWVFIPAPEGIWTVTDPGDALVLRDRTTGREIRRIDGDAPFHATTLAFGSAWATDYDGDALHRYDLSSGKHTEIAVGAGPDAVLATTDAIWIADHAGDSVERLDPTTLKSDRVKVRESTGRGGPGGMVVAGGSLWLTVPLLDPAAGVHPPGLLVEIDLAKASVVRTMELDMIPCGIGASEDVIWIDACGDVAPAIGWLGPDDVAPTIVPLSEPTFLGASIGGREWLLVNGRLVAVERGGLRVVEARSVDGSIVSVVPDGSDTWLGLEDRVVRVSTSDFGS